jgi:nitrogen-specific signal transduction histidine kinase
MRLLESNLLYYFLLAMAFIAMSAYAAQNASFARQEAMAKEEQQARETLNAVIRVWEAGVFSRVDSWTAEISTTENIDEIQERLRRSTNWFDSIFLWEKGREHVSFPSPIEIQEVEWDKEHPCVTLMDPGKSAECARKPLNEQVSIAINRVDDLLRRGKAREAQEWLLESKPALSTSLAMANQLGLHPISLLKRRIQASKAERDGAIPQNTDKLLADSANELMGLDAPELEKALPMLDAMFPLQLNSEEKGLANLSRAHRRLRAYKEIEQRMIPQRIPSDPKLRVQSDPYGDRPFLLLHKSLNKTEVIAIQLDPVELLGEVFKQEEELSSEARSVVLDANGQLLTDQYKEMGADEELWVQVPCGQLFPHLRAGYIRKKNPSDEWEEHSLSLFLPILLAGGLAVLAMIGQIAADRRQKEFLERQQAFIARVTHELKTPLAGIRLMAESLQLGVVTSPDQAGQFIERILMESDRLETRIDEVLQVSRKAELRKRERVDGERLVRELSREWSLRFSEVDGILRTSIIGESEVFADSALLQDALQNLLSNAIKYRSPDRALRCILSVEGSNRWIEFALSDNGIGVPSAQRRRIFERFVRVEGPNRGLAGGHGLGLSFVAEAAKAHRGSIRCTEGIAGGTKFILKLPRR